MIDRDGDKIGKIDDVYEDKQTGKPEWALVNTGLFGTKKTLRAAARRAARPARTSAFRSRRATSRTRRASTPTASSARARSASSTRTTASPTHTRRGYRPAAGDGATNGGDVTTLRPDHRRRDDALRGGAARRHRAPRGRPRAAAQVRRDRGRVSEPCPCAARRSASSASRSPTPTSTQALDGPEISEEEHEVVLHEEQPGGREGGRPQGARAPRAPRSRPIRRRSPRRCARSASRPTATRGPERADGNRPLEAQRRRPAGRLPARRHRRQVLAVRHRQADVHRVQRGQHVRLGGGADLLRAAVAVPGADRAGVDRRARRRSRHDDQDHHRHGHQARTELRGRHVRGTRSSRSRRTAAPPACCSSSAWPPRCGRRRPTSAPSCAPRTSSTRRPRAGRSGSCARCRSSSRS